MAPLGIYPASPTDVGMTVKQIVQVVSGEVTANKGFTPIFAPTFSGHVKSVFLATEGCGRDDSNPLSLEADVLIGGTSVLSTKPKIEANNGSAATAKNTMATGTGVTQGVVDNAANAFTPGQVIGMQLALVRTASPTTEMKNPVVVVELIKA